MSTALVTGSAGFVGSHFMRWLQEDGWRVNGVDIKNGHDALDVFHSERAPYDLVVHAAAHVGGRKVIEHNPLAQYVNFELDAALFQWAKRVNPGRIIYFSSSAAYPVAHQQATHFSPLRESMLSFDDMRNIGMPDAIYGWSKVNGERLAITAREHGVPVTVVRPFSGYGSDQDLTYPFPAFVNRALSRLDPFMVWGQGFQVRDFIHIDDIVDACLRLVRREIDGPVNLGSGTGTSMIDLARMITTEVGYEPVILPTGGTNLQGVHHRVADITEMRKYFSPRVTLAEGIRKAVGYRRTLGVE